MALVPLSARSWPDEERPPELMRQVELGLGVLKTVYRPDNQLSYLSVVIGGGTRLYDAMARHGYTDPKCFAKEKEAEFIDEVLAPNRSDGANHARHLGQRYKEIPLIIPSLIETPQPKWQQAEYMKLWLATLSRDITHHYFPPGWEYGNGTVEEFVSSTRLALGFGERSNITTFDLEGNVMPIHAGALLLRNAIVELNQRGFITPLHVHKLIELGHLAATTEVLLSESSEHVERCNPVVLTASDLTQTKTICFDAIESLSKRYDIGSFRHTDLATGSHSAPHSNGGFPIYAATPAERTLGHLVIAEGVITGATVPPGPVNTSQSD